MKKQSFWPSRTSREPTKPCQVHGEPAMSSLDTHSSLPARQAHLMPLQISAQMLTSGGSPRWADALLQLGNMYNYLRWLNCGVLWKEASKRQVKAMRNH